MKDSIKKRRVLSIDCGTAIVGWAILEAEYNNLHHVASGAIKTSKKDVMYLRLKQIYDELNQLIEQYGPTEMAIENLYFFKNQKTIVTVSQARGVTILAGANFGMKVYDYTPLQVKSSVTGYGRAEKKQIAYMVGKILKLSETSKLDDVTDAIAVGICHFNNSNVG